VGGRCQGGDRSRAAVVERGMERESNGGGVRGIYLDHAATTPVRPEVVEAMEPYAADRFGNPSSVHRWGQQARAALEEARERLAAAVGAARREIVFTGSGTEADNLAVLGRWLLARGGGATAVACSAVEHKAVPEAGSA